MDRIELENQRESIDDSAADSEQRIIDTAAVIPLTNADLGRLLVAQCLTSIAIELRFMNDNSVNRR